MDQRHDDDRVGEALAKIAAQLEHLNRHVEALGPILEKAVARPGPRKGYRPWQRGGRPPWGAEPRWPAERGAEPPEHGRGRGGEPFRPRPRGRPHGKFK
jgi:hypothetical protein